MRLINVDPNYIDFLKNDPGLSNVFDSKIELSTNGGRKYVGVCLTVGEYLYYIPIHKGSREMSKPGKTYINASGTRKIKRSKFDIEFIEKDKNGNEKLTSILVTAYMIPIPSQAVIEYDISSEPNPKFKADFTDLMNWVNKENTLKIINNRVNKMYNTKIASLNSPSSLTEEERKYASYWVNYKLAEEKCKEWIGIQENKK